MVNAGAIAAASLVPGGNHPAKWLFLEEGLSRFAGRDLALSEDVYASASQTNYRNRAIANLLASRGRIYCDPAEAVDLYTRQSCLLTSAEDLAIMSATLADGGVNPVTGVRVITPAACPHALAVMATGLGTFPPLLDRAGNSVRGQLAARHLSRTLGLSLFASKRHRGPAAGS